MNQHQERASRTPEEILVWLIDHIIEMEKRMAVYDDILAKLQQADAQAKDRANDLKKAKEDLVAANQKIADLEAAAASAANAAAATIDANQAATLSTAVDAVIADTAAPTA